MNRTSSLALRLAFAASSLMMAGNVAAQKKGVPADTPYYTEQQRQRIYAALKSASAPQNPMIKRVSAQDQQNGDTQYIGDFNSMPPLAWPLWSLMDKCKLNGKDRLGYSRGMKQYNVSIDALIDLKNHYDSLHRVADAPHKTGLSLETTNVFVLENLADDTTYSELRTSFFMMEHFPLKTIKSMLAHEVGHSTGPHRELKYGKNATPDSAHAGHNDTPHMVASRSAEYQCDSLATMLYGAAYLDVLYDIAGYNNNNAAHTIDKKRKKEKLKSNDNSFRFERSYELTHPSLGQRIQYIEALLQYRQNIETSDPPGLPPILPVWKPAHK